MPLLVPISMLGYALLLFLWVRSRGELCVLAAVSGLVGALYIAGLAGALRPAALSLYYLGLAAAFLGLWLGGRRGLDRLAGFLTPGVVLFAALSLAFALFLPQLTLQLWDEFSHWAVATKEMLVTHALPGPQGALIFKEYPVGVNLLHYWAAVNAGDSEAVYYLAHFLLLMAPLAAFFSGLSWRRPLWILGLLAASILTVFTLSVYVCSLMVDVILALYLGAGLFLAARGSLGWRELLLFAPALLALPLVKSTGNLLAWMIIAALGVCQGPALLRQGRGGGGRAAWLTALALLAVLAAPLAASQTWAWRVKALALAPAFQTTAITWDSTRTAFSDQASERHRLTRMNFAQALIHTPLANYTFEPERSLVQALGQALSLPSWVAPPQVGLAGWLGLAGLVFAAAWLRHPRRDQRRRVLMVLALFLGFGVVYMFGLLLLYLFTFSEYEGPRLASFARYVNTLVMPLMLSGLALALPAGEETDEEAALTGWRAPAYWACLGLALLGVLAQAPSWAGAPKWLAYGDASEERSYITPLTEEVKRLTPPFSRVFIVYQNSAGRGFHIARYEIAPRPANKWFFSLGRPYREGDVWTEPLTPAQWSDMLKAEAFDYVFLERSDDQFWQTYGELFAPASDPRRFLVFRVVKDRGPMVALEPVGEPRAPGKVWWGPGDWR